MSGFSPSQIAFSLLAGGMLGIVAGIGLSVWQTLCELICRIPRLLVQTFILAGHCTRAGMRALYKVIGAAQDSVEAETQQEKASASHARQKCAGGQSDAVPWRVVPPCVNRITDFFFFLLFTIGFLLVSYIFLDGEVRLYMLGVVLICFCLSRHSIGVVAGFAVRRGAVFLISVWIFSMLLILTLLRAVSRLLCRYIWLPTWLSVRRRVLAYLSYHVQRRKIREFAHTLESIAPK